MIYGMYLSATGVLANSYRQDVIANNLANSETVGFKRDLSMLRQRASAKSELGLDAAPFDPINASLDPGMLLSPTMVDTSQGELERTGNNMDVAIQGSGYFAVEQNGQVRLTRNGHFQLNGDGQLVLSSATGADVLDARQKPITLDPTQPISIGADGTVTQGGAAVAQIGTFDVSNPASLQALGGTMLAVPPSQSLQVASPQLHSEFIERSNVEPATELTALIEAQRQLEANANMIQTQDETLDKLVNDVGKVS